MNQDRPEKRGRRCVVYIPESTQVATEEAFKVLGIEPLSGLHIARLAVRLLDAMVRRQRLAPIVKLIEEENPKKARAKKPRS